MNIYLLGIGGIGMSAIAKFYHYSGYRVAGYDRISTKLTEEMSEIGIDIHYNDDIDIFKEFSKEDKENTLIIYTPAIPEDFGEYQYILKNGYKIIKRSKALGEIAKSKICYGVAGTHGKTSTSTILAHLIMDAGEGCTAFLGGISKNYHSNLLLSKSNILVAEADEFDRSFLQLYPKIAIITSTDADHLDIYGDYSTILRAFSDFASQIDEDGALIIKEGVTIDKSKIKSKIYTYKIEDNNGIKADFFADNIRKDEKGDLLFDLSLLGNIIQNCQLGIPGKINIENAVAASAVAFLNGIAIEKIKESLDNFQGVERRFDIIYKGNNSLYIDDYAHHPEELKATINSIRELYPKRKITGIFQPHLYTRTRDFADEFADVLSQLDELILLEIYPARELPIEGINSELILNKIKDRSDKKPIVLENEKVINYLKSIELDILITFGAGDISNLVPEINEMLKDND